MFCKKEREDMKYEEKKQKRDGTYYCSRLYRRHCSGNADPSVSPGNGAGDVRGSDKFYRYGGTCGIVCSDCTFCSIRKRREIEVKTEIRTVAEPEKKTEKRTERKIMEMMKQKITKETCAKMIFIAAVMTLVCALSVDVPVLAKGSSASSTVTKAFGPVYQIISALVSSCGQLFLLWGVFEWAIALNSSDGTMQAMAFKRIGGGLVACLSPTLIPLITKGIQGLATLA